VALQVRQTVAERQVKQRGSQEEQAAAPASKYLFMHTQNGLMLVSSLKLLASQVLQDVPLAQVLQTMLQAMQGTLRPSS
jgi:hypothetical protein